MRLSGEQETHLYKLLGQISSRNFGGVSAEIGSLSSVGWANNGANLRYRLFPARWKVLTLSLELAPKIIFEVRPNILGNKLKKGTESCTNQKYHHGLH